MSRANMETLIQDLPKAELHIHIEGTLEPEMMFALAKRNNVTLRYESAQEVRQAYNFVDLQSFLDIYYQSCAVLIAEQDFYDLTWAYIERVSSQNVRHVELFFDPQTHTARGISFETVVKGIYRAAQEARQEYGMSVSLIMCFLRHLSAEECMQTLEDSLPFKSMIAAVGLDSGERGNPPEKFSAVFERARNEGYLAVAHAGEEGPPDYIWQALNLLKVKRIDHGVRCVEDPELVKHLAKEQIPLTTCPLSNLKLRVVSSLAEHPLKKLLDAGICATVNSDDPAYFGGYIAKNFVEIQKALGLSADEIIRLAKNSFQASFMPEQEKTALFQQIDRIAASPELAGEIV
jgi:adenine deaminase